MALAESKQTINPCSFALNRYKEGEELRPLSSFKSNGIFLLDQLLLLAKNIFPPCSPYQRHLVVQITTSTIKPTLGNSFLCFCFSQAIINQPPTTSRPVKRKQGPLLFFLEMKPEEKNIQRSPNKQRCPTLLLFKKTPSRKTSELGEAIIVTTDRKTDIPSHVALTKTGRCINCQQQQSFPPHRTTKSIYIGNW